MFRESTNIVQMALVLSIFSSVLISHAVASLPNESSLRQASVVIHSVTGKHAPRVSKKSNGVIISAEGHILASSHALGEGDRFVVKSGHSLRDYDATLVYRASNKDLAILKIHSEKTWVHASIGATPIQKQKLYYLTRNVNDIDEVDIVQNHALLSDINMYFDSDTTTMSPILPSAIIINEHVEGGQSGSGLYNQDGELVGILISSTSSKRKGKKSIALSAELIKPILQLELSGHFHSNDKKALWLLEGLVNTFSAAGSKSKVELDAIKQSIYSDIVKNPEYADLAWEKLSILTWSEFFKRLKS